MKENDTIKIKYNNVEFDIGDFLAEMCGVDENGAAKSTVGIAITNFKNENEKDIGEITPVVNINIFENYTHLELVFNKDEKEKMDYVWDLLQNYEIQLQEALAQDMEIPEFYLFVTPNSYKGIVTPKSYNGICQATLSLPISWSKMPKHIRETPNTIKMLFRNECVSCHLIDDKE